VAADRNLTDPHTTNPRRRPSIAWLLLLLLLSADAGRRKEQMCREGCGGRSTIGGRREASLNGASPRRRLADTVLLAYLLTDVCMTSLDVT